MDEFRAHDIQVNNRRMGQVHAAVIIIQKFFRLKIAQQRRAILQWARYNWAAAIIQRAYQKSQAVKRLYYNHYRKLRDRRCGLPAGKTPVNPLSNARDAFQKVINAKATYEEKMLMWRMAIELRRGHNFQTTDTCIKAILESQADLKQAIVLLGIPEFCVRHFSELPKHTKKLFTYDNNLLLLQPSAPTLMGAQLKSPAGNAASMLNLGSDPAATIRLSLEAHRGAGIETIRALKRLQRRQSLIDTINFAVTRSQFSKHHVGSKYSQPVYPKVELLATASE